MLLIASSYAFRSQDFFFYTSAIVYAWFSLHSGSIILPFYVIRLISGISFKYVCTHVG